jgi:hypothetical protein
MSRIPFRDLLPSPGRYADRPVVISFRDRICSDARARGADHLCQHLLADFGNHRLRLAVFAKVRKQQKRPGKTFLAGIEQLIDQIRFNADGPRQKVGHEHLGKGRLLINEANNSRFVESRDRGVGHCHHGRHAPRLSREAALA